MVFPELTWDVWTILIGIAALMFCVQVFYFIYFHLRLAKYQDKRLGVHEGKPVSVVIAARNEADNLERNLPEILEQDYSEYQVVVVNDRSWDRTAEVLENLAAKYPHLHVITIQESDLYQHGKKMAVTLGVKGAKHDYLLFTDADCRPTGKHWITEMVRGYDSNDIVLGYSPYERRNSLVNWLVRFDTVQIGLQYLSFALAGVPYMGVGRNLSYKKELFFKVKGFKRHYHVASGDDDLFINETAHRRNVRIRVNKEAFTHSAPKTSFKSWWTQKKRHFSTSGLYKFKHKVLLALYPMSFLLFLGGVVASAFGPWIWVALGLFGLRIFIQLLIFSAIYRKLGERDLLILTPILEPVFLVINPMIHVSNAFVKPTKWA